MRVFALQTRGDSIPITNRDERVLGDAPKVRYGTPGPIMDLISGVGLAANIFKIGTNVVYKGIDAAGVVRYVGITNRLPQVRFMEHLNSLGTGKELLRYDVIDGATGLSRTSARVLEQNLINQYGLQKDGGLLINKINSISPKKWWMFGIK